MTEVYLIRHGKTYGNTLGRYIGTTDEDLCEEGREALLRAARELWRSWELCEEAGKDAPEGAGAGADASARPVDKVYISPLKRCRQSAEVLFPGLPLEVVPELRECDFGAFENRNYQELSGDPRYQAWVDSGGTLPFPGGESREAFEARCLRGFEKALRGLAAAEAAPVRRVAFVVHGGTIMSILGNYADPPEPFYHWQVKNGEGFRCLWDGSGGRGNAAKGGIRLYAISHLGLTTGFFA